ncbi:monooxygenase 2-like [Salvia divinorum]|uniref:Monooxygenase 2-like n=1 Tax=Salvia divinorum TaxID=28513 RepID=A0ABD1IAW2_SALDI
MQTLSLKIELNWNDFFVEKFSFLRGGNRVTMDDIVIVGAGIAGLAISLGLHRLGVPSVVLESADRLRASGFALGIWANGWRALDSIGVGNKLREKHNRIRMILSIGVDRGVLLGTLENELPRATIGCSSKVVRIQSEGCVKSLHLYVGTVLRERRESDGGGFDQGETARVISKFGKASNKIRRVF